MRKEVGKKWENWRWGSQCWPKEWPVKTTGSPRLTWSWMASWTKEPNSERPNAHHPKARWYILIKIAKPPQEQGMKQ
eukprot:3204967-Amphidinium_carterae.1